METATLRTGIDGLAVPVWRAMGGGGFEPLNPPARAWEDEPGWSGLARLMTALVRIPGRASGSYESEGKVHQILTLDADDGPLVVLRPVRDGERDGEVERRLAEIVHDLNAPITSLRLRLGGVRQRSEDPAVLSELTIADGELSRLQAVVRDAVALGRLSAHIVDLTEVPAAGIVEAVGHTLRPIAEAKEVRLQLESDPGFACVDRTWIERALVNLGDNAVRHSPAGETVLIEARADATGWAFRVRDRGRGISPEVLSGLDAPPFQELPHEKGLAGLGLTLVRRIVAAHDGDLEVASEEGMGSTFTLSIPNHPPSPR